MEEITGVEMQEEEVDPEAEALVGPEGEVLRSPGITMVYSPPHFVTFPFILQESEQQRMKVKGKKQRFVLRNKWSLTGPAHGWGMEGCLCWWKARPRGYFVRYFSSLPRLIPFLFDFGI